VLVSVFGGEASLPVKRSSVRGSSQVGSIVALEVTDSDSFV